MAKVRRNVGGYIWNDNVDRIRGSATIANSAVQSMIDILERNRTHAFLMPLTLYLTKVSSELTTILAALTELEEIAKSNGGINNEDSC